MEELELMAEQGAHWEFAEDNLIGDTPTQWTFDEWEEVRDLLDEFL